MSTNNHEPVNVHSSNRARGIVLTCALMRYPHLHSFPSTSHLRQSCLCRARYLTPVLLYRLQQPLELLLSLDTHSKRLEHSDARFCCVVDNIEGVDKSFTLEVRLMPVPLPRRLSQPHRSPRSSGQTAATRALIPRPKSPTGWCSRPARPPPLGSVERRVGSSLAQINSFSCSG